MRIFIYECICAGGMGPDAPESLRREGRAMLDAVIADFRQVPNVEVVTTPDEAGFLDLAARSDYTLVIAPECGDILANCAQTVLDVGGRLLGPLPSAIRQTADKLHLANVWQRRAVPHPATILLTNDEPPIALPWVVKPRDGVGSQSIFTVFPISELRRPLPSGDFLVQQQVFGQAASVALLIGPAQTVPLVPARQHLSQDGHFRYEGGSLPIRAELASRATELALRAVAGIDGLQGYVGVDLVLGEDGIDYAIEINPRLTTSYIGLRQLCQDNLAGLMLKVIQGQQIETPAWRAGEVAFLPDGTIRRQSS